MPGIDENRVGLDLDDLVGEIDEESETPEECAQRELQEETGQKARSLQSLGSFWSSPGFCDELMHPFIAKDLMPSALEPDSDENIQTERVPFAQIAGLIQRGDIRDAKTIAAFLMASCLF